MDQGSRARCSRTVTARRLSPLGVLAGIGFLLLALVLLIPLIVLGVIVVLVAVTTARLRIWWRGWREDAEEPKRENVRVIPPGE